MNLVLPTVSQTPGPQWASIINSDLTLIDQHDHTPGFGAPIPVAALNINDSLAFGNNAATGVGYLQFNPQTAAAATSSLYVDGNGDFFYNNSLGGQVQITSGGGLAALRGRITNLPSGTAAVAFSSGAGKYTFTKATNEGAVLDSGPIILRTGAAGSNGVGIVPHPSTANYALQLPPSLPGNPNLLLGCSTLGVMSFLITDSSLSLTSSLLSVAPSGITATQLATNSVQTAKIQDGAVTYAKLQAANCVVPSGGGVGILTSLTYQGLLVSSATINVVAGRPLILTCMSNDNGLGGNEAFFTVNGPDVVYLRFAAIGLSPVGGCYFGGTGSAGTISYPPSMLSAVIASPTAGLYSFYLEGKSGAAFTSLSYSNIKVVAYQI
jgi:hypothetical protein